MERVSVLSEYKRRRALGSLVALVAFVSLGCDNSMNFNPAAPEWPDWPANVGARNLEIKGTLGVQSGAVLEATVLYDGLEVPGARSRCPRPAGCDVLELKASVGSPSGHHTISFQVLRQSPEVVGYRAEGTVFVSREGLDLGGVPYLRLGPRDATLESGGAVTFDVHFLDW